MINHIYVSFLVLFQIALYSATLSIPWPKLSEVPSPLNDKVA
jgi:hypothetical protein